MQTPQLQQQISSSANAGSQPSQPKPTIIGIYGVSGSGKSQLLEQLRTELPISNLSTYDGSTTLLKCFDGTLEAFNRLPEDEKKKFRKEAITTIAQQCRDAGTIGVVAGHYMLWNQDDKGDVIWTEADQDVYTHIVYLKVPGQRLYEMTSRDFKKRRTHYSVQQLEKWIEQEESGMRQTCLTSKILFASLPGGTSEVQILLAKLIKNFLHDSEDVNDSKAADALDAVLEETQAATARHIFVIDGDRTLAAENSGSLFWETLPMANRSNPENDVFRSAKYTFFAFRQVALLYNDIAWDKAKFVGVCDKVAAGINLYEPFLGLLNNLKNSNTSRAIVVTCGLQAIWARVLEKEGLSDRVKVIGSGPLEHGYFVTPKTKKDIVVRLQKLGYLVSAFGDSTVDVPMLQQADRAIVVVGEEGQRSTSIDSSLAKAIDDHGFQVRQFLAPHDVKPRMDTGRLPLITASELANEIPMFQVIIAAHKNPMASQVLTTPTRDARNSGLVLREAHHKIGWYLALQHLSHVLGLDDIRIPHVQEGKTANGHRISNEKRTLIIPLMRGGEPMAFGVAEALPLAAFHHAKEAHQIESKHLKGMKTVILVDSVINTGSSLKPFVEKIRELNSKMKIVIVANVVQQDALAEGSMLRGLGETGNLSLVALRTSPNSFKGKGGTDTGHRLFNTTYFDKEVKDDDKEKGVGEDKNMVDDGAA